MYFLSKILILLFNFTINHCKWLIYNVVLLSSVQQSDSVIHMHISILSQIIFPYRLLQNTEKSSLCYTLGPCCLFYTCEWASEVTQSCLTLCDPMDCSLPGSSIHVIFQASILEWVAISYSRRSSRPRDLTHVSRIVGRCFTVWATRK